MFAAALALPLAASATADVPDDPLRFDVQCLIATGHVARSGATEHRAAARSASIYYLGRLDGRGQTFDLEASLLAEAAALRGQDGGDLLRACGQLMVRRGAEVQAIGARVLARERAAPAR
jgi:hypothetical protein